jgi:hypothetical protein
MPSKRKNKIFAMECVRVCEQAVGIPMLPSLALPWKCVDSAAPSRVRREESRGAYRSHNVDRIGDAEGRRVIVNALPVS